MELFERTRLCPGLEGHHDQSLHTSTLGETVSMDATDIELHTTTIHLQA